MNCERMALLSSGKQFPPSGCDAFQRIRDGILQKRQEIVPFVTGLGFFSDRQRCAHEACSIKITLVWYRISGLVLYAERCVPFLKERIGAALSISVESEIGQRGPRGLSGDYDGIPANALRMFMEPRLAIAEDWKDLNRPQR